jgi:hypothetical protein
VRVSVDGRVGDEGRRKVWVVVVEVVPSPLSLLSDDKSG